MKVENDDKINRKISNHEKGEKISENEQAINEIMISNEKQLPRKCCHNTCLVL
jgi:hypothetical protein